MTLNLESPGNEFATPAAATAAAFMAQAPDPLLSRLLAKYPDHLFSQSLYASIELAKAIATELAIIAAARVGFLPQLRVPRSVAELQRRHGLADAFAPALAWLLERLAAAGLLMAESDGGQRRFLAVRPRPAADPALLREAALMVDPANAATCDLLAAAAAAYPAIARGERSGREALLGAGQVELWLRYFSNDNPLYAVNNWIAARAAVDRLAQRARQGAPLRLLEVGAGAGSGSERLLDLLQEGGLAARLADFRITEPSALFARQARRRLARFRDLPLAFAGLDIDRPWDGQGVDPGSVDLVYAVNVLHVSRDLGFTLREARRALAPGGWLVAGECLRPDAHAPLYIELVFRLLQDEDIARHPAQRPQAGFLEWRCWRRPALLLSLPSRITSASERFIRSCLSRRSAARRRAEGQPPHPAVRGDPPAVARGGDVVARGGWSRERQCLNRRRWPIWPARLSPKDRRQQPPLRRIHRLRNLRPP